MKKTPTTVAILICLVVVGYFFRLRTQNTEVIPPATTSSDNLLNPLDCLSNKERDSGLYLISPLSTYVSIWGYQEGIASITIKDAKSCKDMVTASREGTEFRSPEWSGDSFKFKIILTRRPLKEFFGNINTKTWVVDWSDE